MCISKIKVTAAVAAIIVLGVAATITFKTISQKTQQKNIEQMQTMIEARADQIQQYAADVESMLSAYGSAPEISEVCKHPDDDAAMQKAQDYTVEISNGVEDLEGIYTATWDAQVLVHPDSEFIGLVTRRGDSLKLLQDQLLDADDAVYNNGFIFSPVLSDRQSNADKRILSMYKAIYDEDHVPIGYVGIGMYTKNLVNALERLGTEDLSDAAFSMVNAASGKYLFAEEDAMIGADVTDEAIINICNEHNGKSADANGSFEITKDGKKYICAYSYRADNEWMLMMDIPQ